jgi:predicted phosphodiesterase
MLLRFIGDIHGDFAGYNAMQVKPREGISIQVGDFGFGFSDTDLIDTYGPNFVIRGNHDDPSLFELYDRKLSSGVQSIVYRETTGEFNKLPMFVVNGAYSVDKMQRTEGFDWWSNEEHSISQLNDLIDIYEQAKPEIVVSHDCPTQVRPLSEKLLDYGWGSPSRTSAALQSMLYIHKPKLWVFGHYHQDMDELIDGTRFICVNKNTYIDINV